MSSTLTLYDFGYALMKNSQIFLSEENHNSNKKEKQDERVNNIYGLYATNVYKA